MSIDAGQLGPFMTMILSSNFVSFEVTWDSGQPGQTRPQKSWYIIKMVFRPINVRVSKYRISYLHATLHFELKDYSIFLALCRKLSKLSEFNVTSSSVTSFRNGTASSRQIDRGLDVCIIHLNTPIHYVWIQYFKQLGGWINISIAKR